MTAASGESDDRPSGLGPRLGEPLLRAMATVDALRDHDAWCATQTHASLARYAVEEGHEVAAAAEAVAPVGAVDAPSGPGALIALRDELGDLLLQVVLHARLASERDGGFDLDDVAASLVAKARRRHPHVFAGPSDGHDPDVAELEAGWESLKDAERGGRDPLDDLPASLPALVRAQKVLALAERSGAEVPPPGPADPAGIGADLLALAERARRAGLDAESELRTAVAALEASARAARTPTPAAADRGA